MDRTLFEDALIENGFLMMGRNNQFVSISIYDAEFN